MRLDSRSPSIARAAGLLVGFAIDRVAGDPRRAHPVAAFGSAAARWEHVVYADNRTRGAAYAASLTGAAIVLGVAGERATARSFIARTAVTAAATWAVLGGRSLTGEADEMHRLLDADDLPSARRQVRNLVGRDPSTLDAAGLARATIESVAENTSDAVVAPLFWGSIAGIPGLLGYRAINTLDAMVGHKSPRLRRFGWAAARVDDVANYLPARLAAIVTAGLAPVFGQRPGNVLAVVRRDAGRHPSPNAGVVEAATAAALGISLGGANVYDGTIEDRGVLGDGPAPQPRDIDRSSALSRYVGVAAAALSAMAAGVTRGRR